MKRLFGTDGIRGKAQAPPIDGQTAKALGTCFVKLLFNSAHSGQKPGPLRIVVCRDTRISGPLLEGALIAGITQAGGDVLQLGVLPSNAVSYNVLYHKADGGIMVSASHNPADENGFKFFGHDGCKLSDEQEALFESHFFSQEGVSQKQHSSSGNHAISSGKVHSISPEPYLAMLSSSIKKDSLSGLRIAVDAGNGAASLIAKPIFESLGASVVLLSEGADGRLINKGCGALYPERLQEAVRSGRLDAGIAFDGDADRLVMVDEQGTVLDGDALVMLAALSFRSQGKLKNNLVVVTEYSNKGLDDCLSAQGISTIRVKAGDKYVTRQLLASQASIGGENSGHIMFPALSKTADALLAALQILLIRKQEGRPLSQLAAVMKKYPQVLLNVRVREKKPLEELPSIMRHIEEADAALAGKGRVFVRYSGTENILRILVEGEEDARIRQLAQDIAHAVEMVIGEKA